ncbi:hypothetical protein C8Q80DRAFT_892316 [Daedaleopsis nitida]|nr:hypothetical protein C8Q80DRAFT_892316 [Daedaleopsis nitida]
MARLQLARLPTDLHRPSRSRTRSAPHTVSGQRRHLPQGPHMVPARPKAPRLRDRCRRALQVQDSANASNAPRSSLRCPVPWARHSGGTTLKQWVLRVPSEACAQASGAGLLLRDALTHLPTHNDAVCTVITDH